MYVNDQFEEMERYDLTKLQEELRRELGNGLTDQAVEIVKGKCLNTIATHKTGRIRRHGVISSKKL